MNKSCKRVNVYPTIPVLSIRPAIYSTVYDITLPVGDIERCIVAGAKVEEIFSDGHTIILNLRNFNTDLDYTISNLAKIKSEEEAAKQISINNVDVVNPAKDEQKKKHVIEEVVEKVIEEVKKEETAEETVSESIVEEETVEEEATTEETVEEVEADIEATTEETVEEVVEEETTEDDKKEVPDTYNNQYQKKNKNKRR